MYIYTGFTSVIYMGGDYDRANKIDQSDVINNPAVTCPNMLYCLFICFILSHFTSFYLIVNHSIM